MSCVYVDIEVSSLPPKFLAPGFSVELMYEATSLTFVTTHASDIVP